MAQIIGTPNDDELSGTAEADRIEGRGGNDIIRGLDGNDTLVGGSGEDLIEGGDGNDSIISGGVATPGGRDVIHGGNGNDNINLAPFNNGGPAILNQFVTAHGGAGDDNYENVVAEWTTIIEEPGGGIDTVRLFLTSTWTLPDNIENLFSFQNVSSDLTGNELANRMQGGLQADTLRGEGGNDTLDGGYGADKLYGGAGDDALFGTLPHAPSEPDGAADTLVGGIGNDSYYAEGGDIVTELVGEGVDQVFTGAATYVLGANVENLTGIVFSGEYSRNFTGNELGNRITSSWANDRLDGAAGDDTLNGGAGDDTLIGGLGNDSLLGGDGFDTVQLTGLRSDYRVLGLGNDQYRITDLRANGDGQDTIAGVERLLFANGETAAPADLSTGVNSAPQGQSDSYTVAEDATLLVPTATGLLANDSDANGDPLTVELVTGPTRGSLTLNADGSFSYVPNANYNGTDFFTYRVSDGLSFSDPIAVGLTVESVNDAPQAKDDFGFTTQYQTALTIASVALIDNDSDPDGGNRQLLSVGDPVGGTVVLQQNGDVIFTPAVGHSGPASFRYTMHDGQGGSASATVSLTVGAAPPPPPPLDDEFQSSAANEVFDGGAGNDTVDYGTLAGGVTVTLASARAQNTGAGGLDTLISIENLEGTAQNDRLTGNAFANRLDGGGGHDTLAGGAGNDLLIGGAGDDRLDGGEGEDRMAGGAGNDLYTVDNAGDVVDEAKADGSDAGGIDTVTSSISYTLGATLENLTLTGNAALNGFGNALNNRILGNGAGNRLDGGDGSDTLTGGAGNDVLNGDAGDDRLDGGTGDDSMRGGAGNDSYVVDSAGDVVDETNADGTDAGGVDSVSSSIDYTLGATFENLALTGSGALNGVGNALNNRLTGNNAANRLDGGSGNDTLSGGAGNDMLNGEAGDDKLDGGIGDDRLVGGAGNDSYVVDSAGDVIDEANADESDAGGIDSVSSTVGFTLAATLENLTLTGAAAIDGVGNARDNRITGNNAANRLDGGGGNDTLTGSAGMDSLFGGEGSDTLNGGTEADNLFGDAGNDRLDGGAGADRMEGGAGDDSYAVDDAADVVTESREDGSDAGGLDSVASSVSHALGAYLENLTLTGAAAIDGAGNMLANRITGNAAANRLDGGGGNDTLSGGAGADNLHGGEGDDTLNGGTEADNLFGDAGNDRLDGGAGADMLMGGSGDDSYSVDNVGDVVSEAKEDGTDAGGTDVVNSLVSFTLGGFIENLSLTGTGNSDGTGNDLANRIIGNGGNNLLKGGAGNDTLVGGAGNDRLEGGAGLDTLTGGIGADTFVFASPGAGSVDRITDFVSGTDSIGISAAAFGLSVGNGLTADGDLDPSWFVSGSGQVATASGHGQFVYDTKTKALIWDADGAGGAAAVALATMNTAVTADDFLII